MQTMSEKMAIRDWYTKARVRIIKEASAASRDPYRTITFQPGQEITMIQWGREGRSVDRSAWWTDTDIDGAFIINSDCVQVLEVLEEVPPTDEQKTKDNDPIGQDMVKHFAHTIVMLWMYPDHENLLQSLRVQLDSSITNEEIAAAIQSAIVRIKALGNG
jgi:hypothetical protein